MMETAEAIAEGAGDGETGAAQVAERVVHPTNAALVGLIVIMAISMGGNAALTVIRASLLKLAVG
ncbi:hypothetical protein FRC10_000347 [Ceratobasidium sp. 414]|nr:hypothetical protein FRC10_000347 [Ceratobasidium sp. 414]